MSIPSLEEEAWAFALDALTEEEFARAKQRFEADADFALAVEQARADLGIFALGAEPVEPSPRAKKAFTEALHLDSPFAKWIAPIAKMADLSRQKMQELVLALADVTRWSPGPSAGVTLFHLDGGPATENAVVGFVNIPAGGSFDEHAHVGLEQSFMLQGELHSSCGKSVSSGETLSMAAGSSHEVFNYGTEDAIFFLVVEGGVMLNGELLGPDHPQL